MSVMMNSLLKIVVKINIMMIVLEIRYSINLRELVLISSQKNPKLKIPLSECRRFTIQKKIALKVGLPVL